MTLIVIFHIEDKPFSIMKIVIDMQVYDCSIEVPLLIKSLYSLSLFIRKTFECFLERRKEKKRKEKKKKNELLKERFKEKKNPLHDFVFLP